jgi:hypothetical protein
MAFFAWNNGTGALTEVSDFPVPAISGHSVSESVLTKAELEAGYEWQVGAGWVVKQTRKISKKDFIKRLTAAEYSNIKTAAAANATLDYYWQMFLLAEWINLDDPDTVLGVNMLGQVGLLSAGRPAEVLS